VGVKLEDAQVGSSSRHSPLLHGIPGSIVPGLKGVPGTNVIAYFVSTSVTKKESLIRSSPGLPRPG